MTVPHGLPATYHRDQERLDLVERALMTADGREYVDILRAIDDPHEWGVFADLLATELCVRPVALPHRQAKQEALARERARRRRPPPAETA